MTQAYILKKTEKDDGCLCFHLTQDEDEILKTPVSDTFFVDNDRKIAYEQLKTELEQRYPIVDEIVKNYAVLFSDRFNSNYSYSEIKFKLNSKAELDISCVLSSPEKFADYIREYGIFELKNHSQFRYSYHARPIKLKQELNKYGIYVRPIRGTLEYNPKMAQKQAGILDGTQKRKKKNIDLDHYDLKNLKDSLKIILRQNSNFEINYSYETDYKRKVTICRYIVLYIDLCNLFLKPDIYRYLENFQKIRNCWIKMRQKQKMQYPKTFRSFMNKEAKIDSPESGAMRAYAIKAKLNSKNFPLTGYIKDKFYNKLAL